MFKMPIGFIVNESNFQANMMYRSCMPQEFANSIRSTLERWRGQKNDSGVAYFIKEINDT
jgi:hypothetical protein